MRQIHVAGDGEDRFLLGVDDNIAHKCEARTAGSVQHVVMDRVAVYNAGAGAGIGDELAVVVVDNGLAGGNAGENALAAAREAGEEVRFDKAFCHEQVGFRGKAVDDQITAGGELADIREILRIVAVMNNDLLLLHDLRAELVDQFFLRGAAVAAGGDQDGDIGVGTAFADLRQHRRNDHLARNRTSVVTGDQDHFFLAFRHDTELRSADRIGESFFHEFDRGFWRHIMVHLRYERAGIAVFRNVQ